MHCFDTNTNNIDLNNVFHIENPVLIEFLKIIDVQNWLTSVLVCNMILKIKNALLTHTNFLPLISLTN